MKHSGIFWGYKHLVNTLLVPAYARALESKSKKTPSQSWALAEGRAELLWQHRPSPRLANLTPLMARRTNEEWVSGEFSCCKIKGDPKKSKNQLGSKLWVLQRRTPLCTQWSKREAVQGDRFSIFCSSREDVSEGTKVAEGSWCQQPHLILSELNFRADLGRQALLVSVN